MLEEIIRRLTYLSVTFQDFTVSNNINEDRKCTLPIQIKFKEHKKNNQLLP